MNLDVEAFHAEALVFDVHFHPCSALPALFRYFGCHLLCKTMPPLVDLSALRQGGIDGCALAGIGDRQIGGPFSLKAISRSIIKQLDRIRAEVALCRGQIVHRADEVLAAKREGTLSFLLGLEGGNMVRDLNDLENLHRLGVRLLTLVHLNDNALGQVGASTWNYWLSGRGSAKLDGLTALGEAVVRRMNELGMIIDLSHAHYQTIMDATGLTTRPVVASHAGARAVSDFHRYLSDREITAIAQTGGVIGLWPMYFWGRGMAGPGDFKAHLVHMMNLAGEDHLAIGTDAQGIPGVMPGFTGVGDYVTLTRLMFEAGLNENQVRKILGLNFLRVLDQNTVRTR